MKKGTLLLALLISTAGFSQTDKQLEAISDETCDCLSKKNLKDASMDEVQMELGICLIGAMGNNGVEVDIHNPSSLEAVGEKVGVKLALSCPSFLEFMGNYLNEDPEGFQELIEDNESGHYITTKGKALDVTTNEFVSLKVQNESGRKETFYWFEFFEGSNLLENGGVSILQKDITIEYKTVEYYSPKLEDYTDLKVITRLTLN